MKSSIARLLMRPRFMIGSAVTVIAGACLIAALLASAEVFASLLAVLLAAVALIYVARALTQEFDYPIKCTMTEKAADRSDARFLGYPVHLSDAFGPGKPLTFSFDKDGIAMFRYGRRFQYNPTFVGWNALARLQQFLDDKDTDCRQTFLNSADWFVRRCRNDPKLGAVWDIGYDWNEGLHTLRQPWHSSLSQGVGISVLVRAYSLTKNPAYLDTARRATKIFSVGLEQGGIRSERDGGVYYEEYPVIPPVNVLDGFCFSLLGLHDLYRATGDKHTFTLFNDGVETLAKNMSDWDFHRVWSYYGNHRILSTPFYHKLNYSLCSALCKALGPDDARRASIERRVRTWNPARLSLWQKIRILLAGDFLTLRYSIRMAAGGGDF